MYSNLKEEPTGPKITSTAIPGPKSIKLLKELEVYQNVGAINFFVDYNKSIGNYVFDVDGNIFLDVYNQIASLPLGYNHPSFKRALLDEKNLADFINRPALGVLPPSNFVTNLKQTLMSVAPPGLKEVQTMACGSCSNENAFKAVFINHMNKERGGKPITKEELFSSIYNKIPGSPVLSILSFKGGFHGRTLAALSCTHSKPMHKLDMPSFDWPIATFPRYRYPLKAYEKENQKEDDTSLSEVEELIDLYKRKGKPVAGLIVEPIQSEGGDNRASDEYFCRLRKLASDKDIAFICDEVQTGCGVTGKFWAHEHWKLDDPPDIVCFAKKMLTGGFFYKSAYRPKEGYRIFNTWLGDPAKLIFLKEVLDIIAKDKLIENVEVTSNILLDGLYNLQDKHKNMVIQNVRGRGMICAFDLKNTEMQERTIKTLHMHGIHCGACGKKSIRIRTALIFAPKHVYQFLDVLDNVLKNGK